MRHVAVDAVELVGQAAGEDFRRTMIGRSFGKRRSGGVCASAGVGIVRHARSIQDISSVLNAKARRIAGEKDSLCHREWNREDRRSRERDLPVERRVVSIRPSDRISKRKAPATGAASTSRTVTASPKR